MRERTIFVEFVSTCEHPDPFLIVQNAVDIHNDEFKADYVTLPQLDGWAPKTPGARFLGLMFDKRWQGANYWLSATNWPRINQAFRVDIKRVYEVSRWKRHCGTWTLRINACGTVFACIFLL